MKTMKVESLAYDVYLTSPYNMNLKTSRAFTFSTYKVISSLTKYLESNRVNRT